MPRHAVINPQNFFSNNHRDYISVQCIALLGVCPHLLLFWCIFVLTNLTTSATTKTSIFMASAQAMSPCGMGMVSKVVGKFRNYLVQSSTFNKPIKETLKLRKMKHNFPTSKLWRAGPQTMPAISTTSLRLLVLFTRFWNLQSGRARWLCLVIYLMVSSFFGFLSIFL